jgi:2-dehydro-3-deoxyphosphogluconate aldolase/(4S)-4-hydroxy-2-oxoglutarate aldolase
VTTKTAFDLDLLRAQRCVAIIRGTTTEHFACTAATVIDAGIRILEFPLTTPDVLSRLREIIETLDPDSWIGTGSVTTVAQAQASYEAGAQFLVTPNLNTAVIDYARSVGMPILAGAFSPTEVFTAWDAGATAVKLFPASLAGPGYVRELQSGPFPNIPLIPTGGVTLGDIPAFLEAGALAFGMGGTLLGSAPSGGDQGELRSRISEFHAAVTR